MKKLAFSLWVIIIICLATATFIEKNNGTNYVCQNIYSSVWFGVLWCVLCISSFFYLLQRKMQQNISSFLMHCSFLVILLGALLTSLTASRGIVHLRIGEKNNTFVMADEDGYEKTVMLPFTLSLDTFMVHYYPGTNAPADYISQFTVVNKEGERMKGQVAMNRIFSYNGVRLYQSSFDSDKRGSYLTVNIDVWGIPVTYAGYFFLFVSMIWNLFYRRGKFRQLLKHPLLKRGVTLIALLCLFNGGIQAAHSVLPKEEAARFGKMMVFYNNRVAPLQTLAQDFVTKLTGEKTYKGYSAEQVFTGWLFYPEQWGKEPMFEVKSTKLRQALKVNGKASLSDLFTDVGDYCLQEYWGNMHQGRPDAFQTVVSELDEKVQLIMMLQSRELLKVFPETNKDVTNWYTSVSELPETMNTQKQLFITHAFDLLQEAIIGEDYQQMNYILDKLTVYQRKNVGGGALSDEKIAAENVYNTFPFTSVLYRMNLSIGLITLFLLGYRLLRKHPGKLSSFSKIMDGIFVGLFILSFVILSVYIGLRMYISGRLPMGNGYETMMLIAWCIQLTTLFVYRKIRLMLSFGFLLSGFFLLVASIGQMNPQITPLMPVLSSPLLSLHVSLIMSSYALFSFTFLTGLLSLLFLAIRGTKDEQVAMQISKLHVMSQLFLIPGLFLLGAGIFVGAIWANVSWGRYWGWDPKEVWALITFLLYAIALHDKSLWLFRRPVWFHIYMCIAFLTVLMTYFGVNYVLGGMHSYAG